jgi:hypothetical protein
MDVPNGYDETPFSGSPTSTLSTPMLNCADDMSADNAHPAENSATATESRLERVPVDNSASASGSGTNTSSSHLQPTNINMSAWQSNLRLSKKLEPQLPQALRRGPSHTSLQPLFNSGKSRRPACPWAGAATHKHAETTQPELVVRPESRVGASAAAAGGDSLPGRLKCWQPCDSLQPA